MFKKTVAPPPESARTTSGVPSWLKSAIWIQVTLVDVGFPPEDGELNVPFPFPVSTMTDSLVPVPAATAISSLPSPLKSATAMGEPLIPEFTDPDAANVPSPFPKRIAIVPAFSATTKSVLPSPLKSPVAKYEGVPEIGGLVVSAVKVPSPLPRRMSTVELPLSITARSGIPSPLKSATTS